MIIGNILDIEEGVIVHQVNCQGVMGSGVAKQLSDKYPKVKEEYLRVCSLENTELGKNSLLGYVQFVRVSPTLVIVNVFSQLNYGRENIVYTSYPHLSKALSDVWNISSKAQDILYHNVYVPYKIGCGTANGDWGIVRPLVEDVYEFTVVKREGDI